MHDRANLGDAGMKTLATQRKMPHRYAILFTLAIAAGVTTAPRFGLASTNSSAPVDHSSAQGSKETVEAVLRQYLTADESTGKSQPFQEDLQSALGRLLTEDINPAIGLIRNSLLSGDRGQEIRACRLTQFLSSAKLGHEEQIRSLYPGLEHLTNSPDQAVRAAAIETLGGVSIPRYEEEVANFVLLHLSDPSVEVRAATVRAIGYLSPQNKRAVYALLARSHDEADEYVRAAVIRQLQTAETGAATVDALLYAVEQDKSEKVRQDAARAILTRTTLEPGLKSGVVTRLKDKQLDASVREILTPLVSAGLLTSTALADSASAVEAPPVDEPDVDMPNGVDAFVRPPSRNDNKTNIIVFVHGINENMNTNCANTWKNAVDELRSRGFTGRFRTYGYYAGDTNCDAIYRGNLNTSLETLAKDLAGYIAGLNRRYGKKVDVVAHSMGGLILRRALAGVQRREDGYATGVWVEDAVTMSTPHGGAAQFWCDHVTADPSRQCAQMEQGSSFMNYLHHYGRNPQSDIGTDWSEIYSHADPVSFQPPNGNIEDIDAGHKYAYDKVDGIGHSDLIQLRRGDQDGTWGITWHHATGNRSGHNSRGESPLHLMANALYYYRTW
jgi:HEAT repeat protein/pimeloyl-ACP methyl ester carboxylesterase